MAASGYWAGALVQCPPSGYFSFQIKFCFGFKSHFYSRNCLTPRFLARGYSGRKNIHFFELPVFCDQHQQLKHHSCPLCSRSCHFLVNHSLYWSSSQSSCLEQKVHGLALINIGNTSMVQPLLTSKSGLFSSFVAHCWTGRIWLFELAEQDSLDQDPVDLDAYSTNQMQTQPTKCPWTVWEIWIWKHTLSVAITPMSLWILIFLISFVPSMLADKPEWRRF